MNRRGDFPAIYKMILSASVGEEKRKRGLILCETRRGSRRRIRLREQPGITMLLWAEDRSVPGTFFWRLAVGSRLRCGWRQRRQGLAVCQTPVSQLSSLHGK